MTAQFLLVFDGKIAFDLSSGNTSSTEFFTWNIGVTAGQDTKGLEGHDVESDFLPPNAEARKEIKNELELKLILGSNFKGWNVSENFLFVKNLAGEPWEFGYAVRDEPASGAQSSCKTMHFLSTEFRCRC